MKNTDTFSSLFAPQLVRPALRAAFTKLDPRVQWRNPVMFVVEVVAGGALFAVA